MKTQDLTQTAVNPATKFDIAEFLAWFDRNGRSAFHLLNELTDAYRDNDTTEFARVANYLEHCSCEDYLNFNEIRAAIVNGLRKFVSGEWTPAPLIHAFVYAGKILETLPHVSTEDPALLAYWHKTPMGKCQKIKPVRLVQKLNPSLSQSQIESLNHKFRRLQTGTDIVKFAENNDVEGWGKVYRSTKIKSCMNNRDYSLTTEDTYRCYCTSAHGLADNGLKLSYILGSEGEAVSRAIVHHDGEDKYFVRVYGDDVLEELLKALGYEKRSSYVEGLKLSAIDGYRPLRPYVDGYLQKGDLYGDFIVLDEDGGVALDSTCAEINGETCPCCGESGNELDEYVYMDGAETAVCYSCWANALAVYNGYGDYVRIPEDSSDDFIQAYDSNGNYEYFLDDARTHSRFNIEHSEHYDKYIYGDDVVRVRVPSGTQWDDIDYVFFEDSTYSEVYEEDFLSEEVVWLESANSYVMPDDVETVTVDGVDYEVISEFCAKQCGYETQREEYLTEIGYYETQDEELETEVA